MLALCVSPCRECVLLALLFLLVWYALSRETQFPIATAECFATVPLPFFDTSVPFGVPPQGLRRPNCKVTALMPFQAKILKWCTVLEPLPLELDSGSGVIRLHLLWKVLLCTVSHNITTTDWLIETTREFTYRLAIRNSQNPVWLQRNFYNQSFHIQRQHLHYKLDIDF